MRYTKQVEIAASPARVWEVLADVGRWPSWTPTVAALEVLDPAGPALREGSRLRISQPGMRPTVYTVTDVDDGHRFAWEARRPGLRQRADHAVAPAGAHHARATLAFAIEGPLGRVVSPLAGPTVRRMVDAEADALRRRVEGGPAGQAS